MGGTAATAQAATVPLAYVFKSNDTPYSLMYARRRLMNFFAFTNFRKSPDPWGTVYDSVTKQPLDNAVVTIVDINGTKVADYTTDMDGRFGFIAPPGQYFLSVTKHNFIFPSKKISEKENDGIYSNLYFGSLITVTLDKAVINQDVPIDRYLVDWNSIQKIKSVDARFVYRHKGLFVKLSDAIYYAGLLAALVALVVSTNTYTVLVVMAQLGILCIRFFGKPQRFGRVIYKTNHSPLQFGLVRVFSSESKEETRRIVTDEHGRYYCLVSPGNYLIEIDTKDQMGGYSKVLSSNSFRSRSGFIDKKFIV